MNNLIARIIKAGLLVGTLDITAACIQYYIKTGKGPKGILTYIASAVYGKTAFSGGTMMMIWGLIFHYCVAMSFTILFFLVFKKLISVLRRKIWVAIVYAIFMWALMQFIVVPLTKAPALTLKLQGAVIAILILLFCISIPLSLIAGKYYKQQRVSK